MGAESEIPKESINLPTSTVTKFADLILHMGISLKEISRRTGLSYPTLIDLKKGKKKKYNPRTLRDVAAYLNVSVSDIIEDGQDTSDEDTPFEKLLKDRKITLNDVEDATGISYPILQDIKNGKKKKYHEKTLLAVSKYLDVKPEDLLPQYEIKN